MSPHLPKKGHGHPGHRASLRQGWIDEASAQEGLGSGLRPHRAEELLAGRGTEAGQHRSFTEVTEEDVLMGEDAIEKDIEKIGGPSFLDEKIG